MTAMAATNRVPADLWYFVDPTVYPPKRYSIRLIRFLDGPVWHGHDIATMLGIPVDGFDDEVVTFHAGWETPDGLVPWIPTYYVRALAEGRPDVLSFVDETTSAIAAHAIRRRQPDAIPEPTPIVDRRAETFSIVAAAQLLRRDPAIHVGRETLLDLLKDMAWVHFENGSNVPTSTAIAAGHLVRNEVWLPSDRPAYNRIRITRDGLTTLHKRLGGVAELQLEQLTPTLIDA